MMNRINYIDWMKSLAIIGVILVHVTSLYWYGLDTRTFEWQTLNFFQSITRWCVPFFVIASGELFLSKKISLKTLYLKYIYRLVVVLLIWSIIYALFNSLWNWSTSEVIAHLTKGQFHLWFLVMIIGIYIIIPILSYISSNTKLSGYFLLLWFVFGSIVPTLQQFKMFEFSKEISTTFDFNIAIGFSGYYILGKYLNSILFTKTYKIIIYILGLLSLITTIILSSYFSYLEGKPIHTYFDYFNPFIIISTISIYILIKNTTINLENSLIKFISKHSFGIYLVHIIFIVLLDKMGINTNILPLITIPGITLIVLVLSTLTSFLLKKIKPINKFM